MVYSHTDTQVCGYYGYEKNDTVASNEVCVSFRTPVAKVAVPSYSDPRQYVEWGNANGITINRAVGDAIASMSGRVQDVRDSNGNSVIGKKVKKGSTVTVYIYF